MWSPATLRAQFGVSSWADRAVPSWCLLGTPAYHSPKQRPNSSLSLTPVNRRNVSSFLAGQLRQPWARQTPWTESMFLFQQNKDTYEPFCKVPVITSSKEEQRLIARSNKVCQGWGGCEGVCVLCM